MSTRLTLPRPPQPRPNVRDDGQRPSSGDGMAGVVGVIWGGGEADYFCVRGWTGQISLKLLAKIAQSRTTNSRRPSTSGVPSALQRRAFDDPIPIPGGRHLITLHDAAAYVTRLPRKEAEKPEWQAAIEALLLVAESGDDVCPDRRHESIEPGPHSGV